MKFKTISKQAFFILIYMLIYSHALAELHIDSIYPTLGPLNEPMSLTIIGNGFDNQTMISIFMDSGNSHRVLSNLTDGEYAYDIARKSHSIYVADRKAGVQVFDISEPHNIMISETLQLTNCVNDIDIHNNLLFVSCGEKGVRIFESDEKSILTSVSHIQTSGFISDVTVKDDYAFISDQGVGLRIIDISNISQPNELTQINIDNEMHDIKYSNHHIYMAAGLSGLKVINVAKPSQPIIENTLSLPGYAQALAISETTAFVATGTGGLHIIDITEPREPKRIRSLSPASMILNMALWNQYLYIVDSNGSIFIYDIQDISTPIFLGTLRLDCERIESIIVNNHTAYLACADSGIYVVDVSLPIGSAALPKIDCQANRIVMSDHMAYVADPVKGLLIIDMVDPDNPKEIYCVSTIKNISSIDVKDSRLYMLHSTTLDIVNISTPEAPVNEGRLNIFDYPNDMAIANNVAYIADGIAGIHLIDITDPSSPIALTKMNTQDFASGIAIQNNMAFIANGMSGLMVVDVSNQSCTLRQTLPLSGMALDIDIQNHLAFIAAGGSGLHIIDISNSDKPRLLRTVDTPGSAMRVMAQQNNVYIADGEGGVQIINIDIPEDAQIQAHLNIPGVASDLSVFDNTVAVADSDNGLIILPAPVVVQTKTIVDSSQMIVNIQTPSITGHYSVKVFRENENEHLNGAVSFVSSENGLDETLKTKTIMVVSTFLEDYAQDNLWQAFRLNAVNAYHALIFQGVRRENIRMFCSEPFLDADNDSKNDVYDLPSLANLSQSILEWASDADRLILYLTGHGTKDTLALNSTENLTKQILFSWLDQLQVNNATQVVIVYDACYSGSFLSNNSGTGEKRFLITSSSSDEVAYFSNKGRDSFSYYFWNAFHDGETILDAFMYARAKSDKNNQSAQVEADGDNIPNNKNDKRFINKLSFGRKYGKKELFASLCETDNQALPDSYEQNNGDNTLQTATFVNRMRDRNDSQCHNFHEKNDQDWIMFLGISGKKYTFVARTPGINCDPVLSLYDTDGQTVLVVQDNEFEGRTEKLEWKCLADGYYYLCVSNVASTFGKHTQYLFQIYIPEATSNGSIIGFVSNASNKLINHVDIRLKALSIDQTYLLPYFNNQLLAGYHHDSILSGKYELIASADGYKTVHINVYIQPGTQKEQDIVMKIDPFGNIDLSDVIHLLKYISTLK